MERNNNDDTITSIEEMVARQCSKDELFAFCMENMLSLVLFASRRHLELNQSLIPFCQFDFEQQSQLYQEFYRCLRDHQADYGRTLIYDLIVDYVRNDNPNVFVKDESKQYLVSLQKASEHYVSHFVKSLRCGKRLWDYRYNVPRILEYIFSDKTIIDYLKDIGCLEATIINADSDYCQTIEINTPDLFVQELCKQRQIMEKTKDMAVIGCSGYEINYLWYNLRDDMRNALANDDVGSFMIYMQIYNKKVCGSLLKAIASYGKFKILNELLRKRPDQCKNPVFLIVCGNFSQEEKVVLLKTLESRNPGIIKKTLDESECNLLWYAFAKTNDSGELEQFLLSCGCDPENKMMGLSYRRFRELNLQQKIGYNDNGHIHNH